MFYKDKKGYIATITSMVIMAIIMMVSIAVSSTNYFGRTDSQALEMKDVSREIAFACLEKARLKVKLGTYTGSEQVMIDSNSCTIVSVQNSGSYKIIRSTATVDGRTTNLELTVASSSLETVSLVEKQQF